MKKLLTMFFVVATILCLCTFAVSAAEIVDVKMNGVEIDFDVPAQVINDRTLVPLRAIFEVMGAEVNWDNDTETVTANKGDTSISLQIGSTSLFVNDVEKVIDVPAQLVDDRTLIPARAVAESFGATVDWDEANQTVIITDANTPDFAAMLESTANLENTSLDAKFDMNMVMSDEYEVVEAKVDGDIKMIIQPLSAYYSFNVDAAGVEIPLTMYMVQEEDQLVVYMAIEMEGEKLVMKMASPAPATPEVDPELVEEMFGDYSKIFKVVAQEKIDDKDTVKFVMTITGEMFNEALKIADTEDMYEELGLTNIFNPEMVLDVYVWLDKETSADVKYQIDLADIFEDMLYTLDMPEDVSVDAFDITMDIVGRGTVEEIVVPEDVKAIAIDLTEDMETIE